MNKTYLNSLREQLEQNTHNLMKDLVRGKKGLSHIKLLKERLELIDSIRTFEYNRVTNFS